jgi:hypothetical protein
MSNGGVFRFDFYPSDYLNGIIGLTADEIAAYSVILSLIYDRGGEVAFVGRERELWVRSGMTKFRLIKAVRHLVELGKLALQNGALSNPRANKELTKIAAKSFQNAANSKLGGESTRNKFLRKDNEINGGGGPVGPVSAGRTEALVKSQESVVRSLDSLATLVKESSEASPRRDDPSKIELPREEKPGPEPALEPAGEPIELRPPPARVYATAKHELWGEGKRYLTNLGIAPSRAAPLIGEWLRDSGDDAPGVLDAIRRASEFKPQEPVAWIIRALPANRRNNSHVQANRLTAFQAAVALRNKLRSEAGNREDTKLLG